MSNNPSAVRIGVVTDATCDLPLSFLREHQIDVLPFTITFGEDHIIDDRDPDVTRRFYAEQLAARGVDADTEPFSAEMIRQRFLERIVLEYDYVFCVTIMSSRSPMFENATKASFAILSDYKSVRHGAELAGSFALRVVDSLNMLSGTAVLTAEAAYLARAGEAPNEVRKRLDSLRENICGYLVPGDLYYIRNRGARKGEKSVGLISYAIGSALDIKPVILCYRGDTQVIAKVRSRERAVERMFQHVARQVEIGIDTRHLCVSYGGELAELEAMPGYAELRDTAKAKGIELLASVMSATVAVNVGPGCVSVAYGGELKSFGE